MDYINAVARYYDFFSARVMTHFGKKQKFKMRISGRMNKKSLIIFFMIGFIILFLNINNNEKNKITSIIYFIIYIITIISIAIKSKITYKKLEGNPKNINIYERDLPSNLRPAHVRMLLNDGIIDELSLYATLIDLIDRGYIEIKKCSENKNIYDYKKNEMLLSKTSKTNIKLMEFEKFLIKWFFEKYGKNFEVTTKIIHEKLVNNLYEEQPSKLFIEWQGLVLMAFPFKKYYKKIDNNKSGKYLLLLLLGLFFIQPIGIFISIYALGNLIYASPLCVMNEKGIEEKDRWLDLKRYLIDFSYIQNKTVEMIKIWNYYLTYAIVLDIADTSKSEIEKFIGKNVYIKFDSIQKNKDELKIIQLRDKIISNKEIEDKINEELKKYN